MGDEVPAFALTLYSAFQTETRMLKGASESDRLREAVRSVVVHGERPHRLELYRTVVVRCCVHEKLLGDRAS